MGTMDSALSDNDHNAGGPRLIPCRGNFLLKFYHHGNRKHSSFDWGVDHPFEA